MNIEKLILKLNYILEKYGKDLEVNLLMETEDSQYEFPANDMAVSDKSKKVFIIHEKWGVEINE